MRAPPAQRKCPVHCNSLWSLWYGLLTLALQAYVVYKCVARFLTYISLPWPEDKQPYLELNLYVGLVGAGVVLLPFFFISFMFKIGNLSNDGYKLGYNLSTCSMDPPSVLARSGGLIRNAWHHGGPTSSFIHLVSSFCFLLPRIIIEAKLIEVGFLSRDSIWKTDLEWLAPNNDRLVVLSFFSSSSTSQLSAESITAASVNHPADQIRKFLESETAWHPCSAEYLNYALALIVFAVRYPSVFWKTNKGIAFLFSVQLIGNGLQNLVSFSAMSIMYKVHVIGPQNVLHKYEPFLLNTPISMLLYLLACIIVTASSAVIYMYGYQKFMAFIQNEKEKQTIVLAEGKTTLWMYFPHTAAMCTLIALAVCNGPLLYDFTIIYKGSLDGTVLVFVITTVLHLFLWIVTWLFLTVKMTWKFKLRVTVGRAAVHNAKSIKLVNDIDLHHTPVDKENAPMLIVGFGKTFTIHDQGPKKLIMKTLARAAMETDQELEEEETYWLRGETPNGKVCGPSQTATMRVHASPSLNKRADGEVDCRAGQSPVKLPLGQSSPQTNTVQDTDDRIPKDSIYGTIRLKRKETNNQVEGSLQQLSRTEEDVDSLPPPPTDDGFEDARQPLLTAPKPAPRKGHSQDVLDARSNRSFDSGLPDSSSTTSSTSPPGQHTQQYAENEVQQHRKSTSLDNVNLQSENKPQWKSFSLQRGLAPPTEDEAAHSEQLVAMKPNLITSTRAGADKVVVEQEDPYGRCTNMRLTSFTEGTSIPRDPRLIDLSQSAASTGNLGAPPAPSLPNGTSHVTTQHQYMSNFNTLPAHMTTPHPQPSPQLAHHPNHTLPARVGGDSSPRNLHFPNHQPSGRHFKPFDHRKINPMAEIQENPYEQQANAGYAYGPPENGVDTTYVVFNNQHIPHMPSELRHTNYGTKSQLVHPQVLQHRDSVNYSMASSDSG